MGDAGARLVLGLIGLVAVVHGLAAATARPLRVAAGALIVSALTALPAFFVDVPAFVKLAGHGVRCIVTISPLVLMFSPARGPTGAG